MRAGLLSFLYFSFPPRKRGGQKKKKDSTLWDLLLSNYSYNIKDDN